MPRLSSIDAHSSVGRGLAVEHESVGLLCPEQRIAQRRERAGRLVFAHDVVELGLPYAVAGAEVQHLGEPLGLLVAYPLVFYGAYRDLGLRDVDSPPCVFPAFFRLLGRYPLPEPE